MVNDMKRIITSMGIFCLLWMAQVKAQATWELAFGGTNPDHGSNIHVGKDGFYLSGASFSYDAVGAGQVFKLSADGSVSWSMTFTDTANTHSWACTPLADSGVVVIANANSYSATPDVVHVVRLDQHGTLVWERFLDGQVGTDNGSGVIEARDGGIVLTGTVTLGGTDTDLFVAKIDKNGNLVWSKRVGGSNHDRGIDLIETGDSGFVAVGNTASFGTLSATPVSIYAVKVNKNGGLVWSNAYEFCAGGQNAMGITSTQTGGFAVVGGSACTGFGNNDVVVMMLDGFGNALASRAYGTGADESGNDIERTLDNGYIVGGTGFGAAYNDAGGFGNGFLLKLSAAATVQWANSYGSNGGELLMGVDQKPDSGFVAAGLTMGFGAGTTDFYAVSTNATGQGPCTAAAVTVGNAVLGVTRTSGGTLNNGPVMGTPSSTLTARTVTVTNNCGILPVTSFDLFGHHGLPGVVLDWRLEAGAAVLAIEVLRSDDGLTFYPLGTVDAATRQFVDKLPILQTATYQLIAVLANGERIGSNRIQVEVALQKAAVQVYPQPASDVLHVALGGLAQKGTLRVVDLKGRRLITAGFCAEGESATTVDCRALDAGLYLLQIVSAEGVVLQQQRFVVQ
jgi:hypothetical protein